MFSPHPPALEVAPSTWKYSCVPRASIARCHGAAKPPRLPELALSFSVSLDEEFVRLQMTLGNRVVDLGARNHNYLLLTLARRRLQDLAAGVPPGTAGWVHAD